jgi:hypothetical protein
MDTLIRSVAMARLVVIAAKMARGIEQRRIIGGTRKDRGLDREGAMMMKCECTTCWEVEITYVRYRNDSWLRGRRRSRKGSSTVIM